MRTFFLLLILSVLPAAPHIDPLPPVWPAATSAQHRWPLVCDPAMDNVIQFRWVAAAGESTDPAVVEAQLRDIAQRVNWLFWRDADSFTETRLPAWKVTDDCRLDVRFADDADAGTLPPIGATKLIQIEPADDFCGFAYLAFDDRPGADNSHNRSSFAAVSRRCLSAYIVAHEFLHMIGAVQPTAPHGTADFHSSEFDIMGRPGYDRCGVADKIDCMHDDYFSLSPGDDFIDRWNSADSVFLVRVWKQTTWVPMAMRGD